MDTHWMGHAHVLYSKQSWDQVSLLMYITLDRKWSWAYLWKKEPQWKWTKLRGTWESRLHLQIFLEGKEGESVCIAEPRCEPAQLFTDRQHTVGPTRLVENTTHRSKGYSSSAHRKVIDVSVSSPVLQWGSTIYILRQEDEAWMKYWW